MSEPKAPQVNWDGNTCLIAFPDGTKIQVIDPTVDAYSRLWGQIQAYQGENLINDTRINLLDQRAREDFHRLASAVDGQCDWITRLLVTSQLVQAELKKRTEGTQSVWAHREPLSVFLANIIEMPEGLTRGLVYPGGITSIAAPSGIGKSVTATSLSYELGRGGIFRGESLKPTRVLFIDTDNPRSLVQYRMRQICLHTNITIEVITRDKAPKLLDRKAWEALPTSEFDVVILDSFGGATPGIGEKEARQLQQALDTLRMVADRGPAVIVLENTNKSAIAYRGRGEKTERVDVFYEVRDVTNWTPPQPDYWWEHLPSGDDAQWQTRASRRKKQERIRLAFVCRKFRWGEEPDPFVVEIDFSATPWSLQDITDEISRTGEEAAKETRRVEQRKLTDAAIALTKAIETRTAGDPMSKTEAVEYLRVQGLKRDQSRNLLEAYDADIYPNEGRWHFRQVPGAKGSKMGLYSISTDLRRVNNTSLNPNNDGKFKNADLRGPVTTRTAQIGDSEPRMNTGLSDSRIYAAEQSYKHNEDVPLGFDDLIEEQKKDRD